MQITDNELMLINNQSYNKFEMIGLLNLLVQDHTLGEIFNDEDFLQTKQTVEQKLNALRTVIPDMPSNQIYKYLINLDLKYFIDVFNYMKNKVVQYCKALQHQQTSANFLILLKPLLQSFATYKCSFLLNDLAGLINEELQKIINKSLKYGLEITSLIIKGQSIFLIEQCCSIITSFVIFALKEISRDNMQDILSILNCLQNFDKDSTDAIILESFHTCFNSFPFEETENEKTIFSLCLLAGLLINLEPRISKNFLGEIDSLIKKVLSYNSDKISPLFFWLIKELKKMNRTNLLAQCKVYITEHLRTLYNDQDTFRLFILQLCDCDDIDLIESQQSALTHLLIIMFPQSELKPEILDALIIKLLSLGCYAVLPIDYISDCLETKMIGGSLPFENPSDRLVRIIETLLNSNDTEQARIQHYCNKILSFIAWLALGSELWKIILSVFMRYNSPHILCSEQLTDYYNTLSSSTLENNWCSFFVIKLLEACRQWEENSFGANVLYIYRAIISSQITQDYIADADYFQNAYAPFYSLLNQSAALLQLLPIYVRRIIEGKQTEIINDIDNIELGSNKFVSTSSPSNNLFSFFEQDPSYSTASSYLPSSFRDEDMQQNDDDLYNKFLLALAQISIFNRDEAKEIITELMPKCEMLALVLKAGLNVQKGNFELAEIDIMRAYELKEARKHRMNEKELIVIFEIADKYTDIIENQSYSTDNTA